MRVSLVALETLCLACHASYRAEREGQQAPRLWSMQVINTRTVAALGLLALAIGTGTGTGTGTGSGSGALMAPGVQRVLHCGLVWAARLGLGGQACLAVWVGEVRCNGRLDGDCGSHRQRSGIQGCMGSGRALGQLPYTCTGAVFADRLLACGGRRRWVETGRALAGWLSAGGGALPQLQACARTCPCEETRRVARRRDGGEAWCIRPLAAGFNNRPGRLRAPSSSPAARVASPSWSPGWSAGASRVCPRCYEPFNDRPRLSHPPTAPGRWGPPPTAHRPLTANDT